MKKLDEFLNKPGGAFLMNLLAQSGYSTMPGSPLGAVGRASQATQQQMMQQKQQSFQDDLLTRRLGLQERRLDEAGAINAPRVQSTQTLDSGNIGLVMSDGEIVDTGQKTATRRQVVDIPGRGMFTYDPRSNALTPIASEQTVTEGAANRAGSTQEASTAAQEATKRQFDLPARQRAAKAQIVNIDSTLQEAGRAIGLVNPTSTGFVGNMLKNIPMTDAFALNQALIPIKAAFSFDKLAEMRANSPTGGALGNVSEKELALLENSLVSLNQAQNPGDVKRALTKVLTHYENWKSVINQSLTDMEGSQQDDVSGFRIVK